MPNCDCGGKVLTVYIRQGKPSKWVPLGKMCIQCRQWADPAPLPEDLDKELRVEAAGLGIPLHEHILTCLQGRALAHALGIPPDKGEVAFLSHQAMVTKMAGDWKKIPEPTERPRLTSEPDNGKPICTCTKAERRRPKGKLGPHKLGCPRKGLD